MSEVTITHKEFFAAIKSSFSLASFRRTNEKEKKKENNIT